MNKSCIYIICVAICLLQRATLFAVPLPQSKPVHIEVRHSWGGSHIMYFWLTDLYTKEEKKVKSEFRGSGVEVLDFDLYHPLYDELMVGGSRRIPFYVEPGDSLIISLEKNGKVASYQRRGGGAMKYENLLRHDISNAMFYTKEDFEEDKEQCLFPAFVEKVTRKMQVALDSVSHVADRYGFTAEERNLARCNVQMQFSLWIFEYAPMKASELLAYASQHQGGWESLPEQDKEIEAIQDLHNYGFMCDLSLNDSTYLASKFFPLFMLSYEHTQALNYDQYLYAGTTADGVARADSALVAKDMAITHLDHPSLFMDMAMTRRHVEIPPPVDDGSIQLQEVQVLGTNLTQFYQVFGRSEYIPEEWVKKVWAHDVNLKGPISSLLNHKKIKNYKRAKKLVEQLGVDDAEREALMKAYEGMKKR